MQEKLDAEKVAARKLKVLSVLCMIIISRQEKFGYHAIPLHLQAALVEERGKGDRDLKVV